MMGVYSPLQTKATGPEPHALSIPFVNRMAGRRNERPRESRRMTD
jgi:hypothetical protein